MFLIPMGRSNRANPRGCGARFLPHFFSVRVRSDSTPAWLYLLLFRTVPIDSSIFLHVNRRRGVLRTDYEPMNFGKLPLRRGLLSVAINDLAVHYGPYNPRPGDLIGRHFEDILGKNNEVGEFATGNRAFFLFGEFGVSRPNRVRADRFFDRDLLFGNPAAGILAIEGLARHCRCDALHGVERRDRPIRPERKDHARIEQGAKRIGAAETFAADAFLSPTPVIGGVIWLHRSDYPNASETWNIAKAQVLGVLDAEAAVALAIGARDLLENGKHRVVRAISNRVHHHLQAGAIRGLHAVEHRTFRKHFVRGQPDVVRRSIVGLEEPSRA